MVRSLVKERRDRPQLRSVFLYAGVLLIAGGWMQGQNPTEPPPAPQPNSPSSQSSQAPQSGQPSDNDKQKEDDNHPENPAEKTERLTLEAAQATIHMGEAAMVKARTWENSWVTGVYVEKGRTRLPLTVKERRDLYLQQTLTTPGAYMKRMLAAGIDQVREAPPQWGESWEGYGARFASREGQFISANSLAAMGNAALGYEPRYDQCQCSGFWPRARHAIMRNFMTYNHSEQEMRPQFGLYAGAFGGGVISSTWKPHPRSAWADGGYAVLGQAGYGSLLNLFIEFADDINRKIGLKRNGERK